MKEVKCIFLDIDGTVDNKDRVTTTYTKNVLGKLSEKNIISVICSGRMASYAVAKSKGANCSKYIIADNGSLLYDYLNKKVIFSSNFNKDLLPIIGEICKEKNVECILNTTSGCYRYGDYNYHKHKRGRLIKNIDRIKKDVTQLIIGTFNYDDLAYVRDKILQLGNIQVSNTNMNSTHEEGRAYYCDLNVAGNSKGKAILELIKYLGISKDNTMCFGDSLNDLSMFKVCNYRVAMKNASLDIKKVANYVTDEDNNHDGVAKFIEKNLL